MTSSLIPPAGIENAGRVLYRAPGVVVVSDRYGHPVTHRVHPRTNRYGHPVLPSEGQVAPLRRRAREVV